MYAAHVLDQRRTLQTILFTDIVGSTERAIKIGDREWGSLLQEHHARARREIHRFGGREVKATGDGFLAAFSHPANALLCAWAIRETLRAVGLEVRAGIHMGTVDRHGGDLGGIVIHVGARIASTADPGQILVSNAVREAEMGSGFRFEDRGKHELKGTPGEWRLFSLETLPPDGVAPKRSWVPPAVLERQAVALGVLASLLVASTVIYLFTRQTTGDPGDSEATVAAPGIAVLPFRVGGEDLETWQEGMVDLLSRNLDGIPGYRAIDSRTVLARWRESVDDDAMPDTPTALDIAARAGARYAVLGSVVPSGGSLRLVAELYDVDSGQPISSSQVDGAVDSIFGLVDQMTIQLMRKIVDADERLAGIHLARATTASLPALRAYLAGEVHWRRSEYARAIEDYVQAVEADSTFALAWLHLNWAISWCGCPSEISGGEARRRALRHIDRLPEREALLSRGVDDIVRGRPEGFERLRKLTTKYPDDAMGWFIFGDEIYHRGGMWLYDASDALQAFERTIELDPTFAPAYDHAIAATMQNEPDSSRVAQLARTFTQLTPDPVEIPFIPAIAFGDSAARIAGIAALDSISHTQGTEPFTMFFGLLYFSHPRFLDVRAELLRLARSQSPVRVAPHLVRTLLFRGQRSAALEAASSPVDVDVILYLAHVSGFEIPTARLERALAAQENGQPPDSIVIGFGWLDPGITGYVFRGAWALEQSRTREFQESLAAIRSIKRDWLGEGDSLRALYAEGATEALEGFRAWREGRMSAADTLLENARRKTSIAGEFSPVNLAIRWWEARRALQVGERERAARFLHSLSRGESIMADPLATLALARVQEELGHFRDARENYELFAVAWRDADPELRPLVVEARRAAVSLADLERE